MAGGAAAAEDEAAGGGSGESPRPAGPKPDREVKLRRRVAAVPDASGNPGVSASRGVSSSPGVFSSPGVSASPGVSSRPGISASPGVYAAHGVAARRGTAAILVACLAYVAISLAFFPQALGIRDELGFINQAAVWSRGALSAEGAGLSDAADFAEVGGRHVSWRNPGRSLLILPFVGTGSLAPHHVVSILVHLGITLLAVLYLRRERAPVGLALLVLFHPTLLLYSRTIMADAPCGLLILGAALLLSRVHAAGPGLVSRSRGRLAAAGLLLGLAVVFRYQAGIVLLTLPAAMIFGRSSEGGHRPSRRWRDLATVMGPGLLVVGLIMAYNQAQLGHVLGFLGQGAFSPSNIPIKLGAYLPALLLLWPLMLLTPLLDRSSLAPAVRYSAVPFLVMLLFYSFHDYGTSRLETSVLCLRLLQPVLPLWILAYTVTAYRLLRTPLESALASRPRTRRALALSLGAVTLVALAAGQTAMFRRHQAHLEELRAARQAVLASVPEGATILADASVRKLFGSLLEEQPEYRWIDFETWPASSSGDGNPPAFLAVLPKGGHVELRDRALGFARERGMTRLAAGPSSLLLYQPDRLPR